MPFLSGFAKRKEVRYGTVFPGANLSDFPKLIKITTDADVAAELSATKLAFTEADGTTLAPHGLYPSSNAPAGTIIARVKFASLLTAASTGDVMGYLYYDDSATDQEDKAGTVANGYALFAPLEEDPSGSAPQMLDWVTESNLLTSAGSMTSGDLIAGQVGNALDFDGSDDYLIKTSPSGLPAIGATLTYELITQHDGSGGLRRLLSMADSNGGSPSAVCCLELNQAFGLPQLRLRDWANTTLQEAFLSAAFANVASNTFFAAAYTFSGSGSGHKIYINGADWSFSGSSQAESGSAAVVAVGVFNGFYTTNTANRPIDEVRISSVARSANWLAYAYADDFDNADTFSLGTEEEDGGGGPAALSGLLTLLGAGA